MKLPRVESYLPTAIDIDVSGMPTRDLGAVPTVDLGDTKTSLIVPERISLKTLIEARKSGWEAGVASCPTTCAIERRAELWRRLLTWGKGFAAGLFLSVAGLVSGVLLWAWWIGRRH